MNHSGILLASSHSEMMQKARGSKSPELSAHLVCNLIESVLEASICKLKDLIVSGDANEDIALM